MINKSMSSNIKINDFTSLGNFRTFPSLIGYIEMPKEQLIAKLGNPHVPTDGTAINGLFAPASNKPTMLWGIEFGEDKIATIYDNVATDTPNDWYVSVNHPDLAKNVEDFLNTKIKPQQSMPTPMVMENLTIPVEEA
jgi:hypothetical protein